MKTTLILLLGIGMGTVLGLLIAPEAGEITRKKIATEADNMVNKMLAKKRMHESLPQEELKNEEVQIAS